MSVPLQGHFHHLLSENQEALPHLKQKVRCDRLSKNATFLISISIRSLKESTIGGKKTFFFFFERKPFKNIYLVTEERRLCHSLSVEESHKHP